MVGGGLLEKDVLFLAITQNSTIEINIDIPLTSFNKYHNCIGISTPRTIRVTIYEYDIPAPKIPLVGWNTKHIGELQASPHLIQEFKGLQPSRRPQGPQKTGRVHANAGPTSGPCSKR